MKVIEKFLADGGSADTCDEVTTPALHLFPSQSCQPPPWFSLFMGLRTAENRVFLGIFRDPQNEVLPSLSRNLPKTF